MSKIYRKIALDRLSSPEQLDRLVTVTSPVGWIALIGLGILLILVVIWSFYGRIPTTVHGNGILIKTGGVVSIVAPVQGQVDAIYVDEGERVEKGQLIARLSQTTLLDEIRATKLALAEEENRLKKLSQVGDETYRLGMASIAKQRDNSGLALQAARNRAEWLKTEVKTQENLLKEGLITNQDLIETKNTLVENELKQEEILAQFKNLDTQEQELAAGRDRQLEESRKLINSIRRDLELKQNRLEFSTQVVSDHAGFVVELRVSRGQVVDAGDSLLVIEQISETKHDLEALIYMSPEYGKKIKPGMTVRITPETVKREEYGFMLGEVTRVADFPSSQAGMMRHLKNRSLVEQFTQRGAPIAVFARLTTDPNTTSGFKWSSPKGPPLDIFSGTLCAATVEVHSQPPISLMIPYLKKNMGLD